MPTMAIVEDTLRSLQLCGVLAGDKNENMRMRGYASGHLHPGMRLLDLTGPSPGLLPSRLKKTATSPGEKAILESCEKTYLVIKGADSSVLGRCEAGPGLETARHIEKCAIMGESRDNTCMIRSYSCFCAGLITLAVQEAVCSL